MVNLLSASTSFGRSFGCFASIAMVTTGSETYLIDSNACMSFTVERVSPALACSKPSSAGILPAVELIHDFP